MDDRICLQTTTTVEQRELERRVSVFYADYDNGSVDEDDEELQLNRKAHIRYLHGGLGALPAGFISLDASRTWICYWILHSLALLEAPLPRSPDRASLIAFLASCQHPQGGFGGGPYQLPHLAPTYAAVAALVTLGGEDALAVVDRPALHSYLLRMCVPPERGGGMTMHEGGEVDVRGCYCALAACHMLGLDKQAVADTCGMLDYIARCQSHEGGLGGEPGNEAHGGYAFCGLAAAALLGRDAAAGALDLPALLRWAAACQGAVEGGFMGRTNKLVDGCYSLWQGGVFPILQDLLGSAAASSGTASGASSATQHQQPQQERQATEAAAAADRVADLLLSGGTDWVAVLKAQPPLAVAEAQVELAQAEFDALVDASLEAEDRLRQVALAKAPQVEVDALKQEAVDLVEQSVAMQDNIDHANGSVEFARHSAALLLSQQGVARDAAAVAQGSSGDGLLYNALALQLWLLKCCQGAHGGLRDKPGKPPDYYHSCYCLSGLSSSQHYSGRVLGGAGNRLAKADALCNVVEGKLAAARAFFGAD